jgi:uncharacterized membrane protein
MREFIKSIPIDATASQIWTVLCDVENWHMWTASITSIHLTNGSQLQMNSRATIKQPKFPAAKWRVTEFESSKRFTWVYASPGVVVTASHEINESTTERGNVVTLRLRFDGLLGSMWGYLTRDINMRYLTMEAEGLRRRCEGIA